MTDHTNIHKELDLIQSCINRMANSSFLLKGWYISLATIIVTLLLGQGCRLELTALFLLVITCIFWWLDAFFFKTEILYRWKYEWVIQDRIKENTQHEFLYDLNPYKKDMWIEPNKKNDCIFKYVFSKTLIPLYGIPMVISICVLLFKSLSRIF